MISQKNLLKGFSETAAKGELWSRYILHGGFYLLTNIEMVKVLTLWYAVLDTEYILEALTCIFKGHV